jgi:hypothetical protein
MSEAPTHQLIVNEHYTHAWRQPIGAKPPEGYHIRTTGTAIEINSILKSIRECWGEKHANRSAAPDRPARSA